MVELDTVWNMNTFKSKVFDNPPRRTEGSRFRRHPFKYGGLTVTLSNYDIQENSRNLGRWLTSIQYGTGAGFPTQTFSDGYFKNLEPIIMNFEGGPVFIENINNGFSNTIAKAELLQHMYENQRSESIYVEPTELVDAVRDIIEAIEMKEPSFDQNGERLFIRNSIPKKQVMALYAINKICSIANGERQ